MAKWHIKKDGTPGVCHAEKGKCPLGGVTGDENHFDTQAEAQAAIDERNSSDFVDPDKLAKRMTDLFLDDDLVKDMGGTPMSDQEKQDYLDAQDSEERYKQECYKHPEMVEKEATNMFKEFGITEAFQNAPEFKKETTPADTSKTPGFDEVKYEDLPHDNRYMRADDGTQDSDMWTWMEGTALYAYDFDHHACIVDDGLQSNFYKDEYERAHEGEPGSREFYQYGKLDDADLLTDDPVETIKNIKNKNNKNHIWDDMHTDPAAKPYLYYAQHGDYEEAHKMLDNWLGGDRVRQGFDDYLKKAGHKTISDYYNSIKY